MGGGTGKGWGEGDIGTGVRGRGGGGDIEFVDHEGMSRGEENLRKKGGGG